MEFREGLYYTKEHEWLKVEGNLGIVGITDYAQSELGDIVYVELPEVGSTFKQNDKFAVIESVKAASDVFIPVSGKVIEVNEALEDTPELVNQSPYDEGWLVKIEISDEAEIKQLLSKEDYENYISSNS